MPNEDEQNRQSCGRLLDKNQISTRPTDFYYLNFWSNSICWVSNWYWPFQRKICTNEKTSTQGEKGFQMDFSSSPELIKTIKKIRREQMIPNRWSNFLLVLTLFRLLAMRNLEKNRTMKMLLVFECDEHFDAFKVGVETNVRFSRWRIWKEESCFLRGKEKEKDFCSALIILEMKRWNYEWMTIIVSLPYQRRRCSSILRNCFLDVAWRTLEKV